MHALRLKGKICLISLSKWVTSTIHSTARKTKGLSFSMKTHSTHSPGSQQNCKMNLVVFGCHLTFPYSQLSSHLAPSRTHFLPPPFLSCCLLRWVPSRKHPRYQIVPSLTPKSHHMLPILYSTLPEHFSLFLSLSLQLPCCEQPCRKVKNWRLLLTTIGVSLEVYPLASNFQVTGALDDSLNKTS